MRWPSVVLAVLAICSSSVSANNTPSPTVQASTSPPNNSFVTTQGDQFFVDGAPFTFTGTNAYWLPMLNSTDAVRTTLQAMKDTNVTVVRIWGFNDVVEIPPDNATYFLLFQNGTATVNTGPNGLQRLDNVINVASELGLRVMLTTTNNWNPQNTNLSTTAGLVNGTSVPTKFPHGYLSNDYGGMDLYVRQILGEEGRHDDFYDDETIISAYTDYLNVLIPRYKDNPTVFGWELANDARCNSSLPAKPSCDTTTVTNWHSEIAQVVSQLDPNHLISSGAQGFLCMAELGNCPKSFPLNPPPQTSGVPGKRKRNIKFNAKTVRDIHIETRKRRPAAPKAARGEGKQIRGRWVAAPTKRQAPSSNSPTLDGSFGVDSQDILNIPEIGFSSFQLFPDQDTYQTLDPNLNATQNALEAGLNWIKLQALSAQQVGKPSLLTAFGLVTANNSALFVPFNSSQVLNSTSSTPAKRDLSSTSLTDTDQASIYSQWVAAAIEAGINGLLQYQWTQTNLNPSDGGGIVTQAPNQQSTSAPNPVNGAVVTPNEGYGAQTGTGPGTLIGDILNQALALQDAESGLGL